MSGRYNQAFYLVPSLGADGLTPNPGVLLDGSTVISASFVTLAAFVKDLDGYSIQLSTPAGSTLVGTATLEVSNDRGNREQTGVPDPTMLNFVPISFTNGATLLTAANFAVASGANQFLFKELSCLYRWARVRFVFTSGSGQPRVSMQQKGWP